MLKGTYTMKHIAILSAAALGVAAFSVTPALATTSLDANLTNGVYFGGGNSNGHFTVETDNGIELGLRGKVPYGALITPVGNVYNFNLGDTIGIDFSYDGGGDNHLANLGAKGTSFITITNLTTNGVAGFNPFLIPDNTIASFDGIQNSEALNFGFLNGASSFNVGNINYNANTPTTYKVTWQFGDMTNTIYLDQGGAGAVPEPATWALMLMGIAVVGGAMRRRKTTVSFA